MYVVYTYIDSIHTARTGGPEQDRQNRKVERERQNREEKKRQPELDNLNWTGITRLAEQNWQNMIGRTGLPGKDYQTGLPGQDCLDRAATN